MSKQTEQEAPKIPLFNKLLMGSLIIWAFVYGYQVAGDRPEVLAIIYLTIIIGLVFSYFLVKRIRQTSKDSKNSEVNKEFQYVIIGVILYSLYSNSSLAPESLESLDIFIYGAFVLFIIIFLVKPSLIKK